MATELSARSLEGAWMFTHIIMDGEREVKVNRKMQFFGDGSLVNYDVAGNKKSPGTCEVTGNTIKDLEVSMRLPACSTSSRRAAYGQRLLACQGRSRPCS
jgi:hypothetical protein